MKTELIQNIGLSDKEASVYLAILNLGEASIVQIARLAQIKRTSIYYFIDHLVELDLIERIIKKGNTTYRASTPQKLVDLQQKRLEQTKGLLPEIMNIFNTSQHKPHVNYYEGYGEVKNVLMEEARCQKEALYIWPGKNILGMIGGKSFLEMLDSMRREHNVSLKVIVFPESETIFRGSEYGQEHKREARMAPQELEIPMAIAIYDTGKVGFISSEKETFGLLIESREVYLSMKILWQVLWKVSKPVGKQELL